MGKFKKETLDKIKADAELFGIVAKLTSVKPQSLASTIDRNSKVINQYDVVVAVANYLKVEPNELLEEGSEVKEEQI